MRLLLPCLLSLLLGLPAIAGPASERVFSREALDLVGEEGLVVYNHVRAGDAGDALRPIEDGRIHVKVRTGTSGSREAAVKMGSEGQMRDVSIWPATSGNPVLPIFLESTLRTMSRATGGSEFYIRNRIKDALSSGGTIEDIDVELDDTRHAAQAIVFRPFRNDKNRDRMGAFADLELRFVVSKNVPGDIVRFVATTGGAAGSEAYREEIAFREVIGGK